MTSLSPPTTPSSQMETCLWAARVVKASRASGATETTTRAEVDHALDVVQQSVTYLRSMNPETSLEA